ncbi:MAG: DMT family transporter [Pseudomonadota bacterium]
MTQNTNLRGAALMVLAMLGFAIEDAFIKALTDAPAGALPIGQVIAMLGLGGAALIAVILRVQGARLWHAGLTHWSIWLRNGGEMIGTLGFVTAIALIPLSTASAILQATPLVVTMGAALFLGEAVGWRRWAAVLVGFAGVMLIVRPGMDGFNWLSLFALQGVLGLAIRDLATRRVPASATGLQLSLLAFATLVPAAGLLMWGAGTPPVMPQGVQWALIAGSVGIGVMCYYCIVLAMRVGEVSFVTPFRYSRILFALVIAMVFFGERPDTLTLTGCGIVVASGLYMLWRERVVKA